MENDKINSDQETRETEATKATNDEEDEEAKPIYETLKADNEYEITSNIYPYIVRRKSNHYIVSIWHNDKGYNYITLNGKKFKYHRVIALQWLDNPNNLPEIDHLDRNKDNNRIQNLRWVSRKTNQENKGCYRGIKFNFVDELSDNAIIVNSYNEHKFEFLYFDNNKFYFYNGLSYKELRYYTLKNGSLIVSTKDTSNKLTMICLNKFKKLYNLI